jgi:hypothetical protein
MKTLSYRQLFWLMLCFNLLLLSLLLWQWNRRPLPPPLFALIETQLELSSAQGEQLRTMAKKHREGMKQLSAAQDQLLRQHFQNLIKPTADTSLMPQILVLEQEKIEWTYAHLREIQHLAGPNKAAAFEQVLDLILARLLHGPPPGAAPPPR